MAHSEDHIALAAEYALGTLDADERAQVETMMAVDTEFAAVVQAWEHRLGALNQMVGSIEPRPIVWENIKAAIRQSAVQQTPLVLPEAAPAAPPSVEPVAEPVFPSLHDRSEFGIDGHHGLDLRALIGIEGAERIFRGERDMVFAMGHHSRSGHQSPRHSLMSIMLRRSHVFTVFTGVSNLRASCSRLQPL